MLNSTRDTMQVNIAVSSLTGPITGIHIHTGDATSNGPVTINLVTFLSGNIVRTRITGAALKGILPLMFTGGCYVNVHTKTNPGGEIRGQVTPEADILAYASLTGAQEAPTAVVTGAKASAILNVSKDGRLLYYNIMTTGLSGAITAAHIHDGVAGVAGGVAISFVSGISTDGKSVSGVATINYPNFMTKLLSGGLYVNVHTAANPGGEVRGQVAIFPLFNFDARLDAAQVKAAGGTSTSPATGLGAMAINATFDTMFFGVGASNLTGAITAAHIHQAPAGTAGGVVFTLPTTPDSTGGVSGIWTASTGLTPALVSEALKGNLYFQIHTAANPGGEVRGQILKLAREGYIMEVSGAQENPAVPGKGQGGGLVSIDRNNENAHYMIAVDSLTGPLSAAHFHKAVKGVNGGVIYALTTVALNNGFYGYWISTESAAFTPAISNQFAADSIYFNLHTALSPGGEVRGQATHNYTISSITSASIEINTLNERATAFPVPVTDVLNIRIESEVAYLGSKLMVIDAVGRSILSTQSDILSGNNDIQIPLAHLAAGIYIVKIEHNGILLMTKKVVK